MCFLFLKKNSRRFITHCLTTRMNHSKEELNPRPNFIAFAKLQHISEDLTFKTIGFWNSLASVYNLTSFQDLQLLGDATAGGFEIFFSPEVSILIAENYQYVSSSSRSFYFDLMKIDLSEFRDIFPLWS